MSDCRIHNWCDIQAQYNNSALILGNGASIAVSDEFKYSSLKEKAGLDNHQNELFSLFQSRDFEKILRKLYQASMVNSILRLDSTKIDEEYQNIRNKLISVIQEIHPNHQAVRGRFDAINSFSKNFKVILNTNYDVLFYWMMMNNNRDISINDFHKYKDGFVSRSLNNDLWEFLNPLPNESSVSLVFYPHGNLILCMNPETELTEKVSSHQDGLDLIDSIAQKWTTNFLPVFVSEGTTEMKLNSIKNNDYTSRVYNEVLPKLTAKGFERLVIFGSKLHQNDKHLWDQIKFNNFIKIAISVYGQTEEERLDYTSSIRHRYPILNNKIEFYNAEGLF